MCGIVGYVGHRNSVPVIVESLSRLEYRGYDSAGISYQNGRGIELYKTQGKLAALRGILPDPLPQARSGLGHTRWATHGAPSRANAHPHGVKGVVVVHNGIIENHEEMRARLRAAGRGFVSDTDTEVIPHLIALHLDEGKNPREAILLALRQLCGSFAVGVMCEHLPNTIFGARRGSPLVLGLGEGESFLASDVPAILPYTRQFVFLEEGEFCTMDEGGARIDDLDTGRRLNLAQRVVEIPWSPSMAQKEGYEHFMLKEIHEQPVAVGDTIGEWARNPRELIDELGLTVRRTAGVRRIHLVACGTSYHAALVARTLIETLSHIPVDVEIASEYRYRRPFIEKEATLFVSITQSGETADTLAAQREAAARGARTLTVTNVVGSTAAREADAVLYTHAGPEIGVASTKAFTAQLAALSLLGLGLGMRRGFLSGQEADAFASSLKGLPGAIQKTLGTEDLIVSLANDLSRASDVLFLGRGISYPIALEGALKLKEISYIHAEGYPAGEMKHGPIALIEDGLPVIVVAPVDELFEKTLSNIEEVRARGGRVIAVTDGADALGDRAEYVLPVPATVPMLSPFCSVIPLQLLAYHAARIRGCDVDQPRNLAKSVTVE